MRRTLAAFLLAASVSPAQEWEQKNQPSASRGAC